MSITDTRAIERIDLEKTNVLRKKLGLEMIRSTDAIIDMTCEKSRRLLVFFDCDHGGFACTIVHFRREIEKKKHCVHVGKVMMIDLKPELECSWDAESNYPFAFTSVTRGSKQVFSWKCSEGHAYVECARSVFDGMSCVTCFPEGKRHRRGKSVERPIPIERSLEDPSLPYYGEFDETRNYPETRSTLFKKSSKYVFWICPEGHSYKMQPLSRSQGRMCPHNACKAQRRRDSNGSQYLAKAS